MLNDIGKKMEGLPSLDDEIVMLENQEVNSAFTEPKPAAKRGKSMILSCAGLFIFYLMFYLVRRTISYNSKYLQSTLYRV